MNEGGFGGPGGGASPEDIAGRLGRYLVKQGGEVILQKLFTEHLQTIMSPARSECCTWKTPIVLIRLGK